MKGSRVSETAGDITSMKIRGALDIAVAAAEALKNVVDDGGSLQELKSAGDILKKARPTAVSLPNTVNYIIRVAEENKKLGPTEFKKNVSSGIDSFIKQQKKALERIAKIGARLIEEKDTVLTHCQSDTVDAILMKAWDDGVKYDVVCTETRPRHQGYLTAKILRDHGIPVTLIIDSAVHYIMKKLEVDKVFVGADTVHVNGDVINKIGTSQVALCAKELDVDFIIATQSIKFSPESVLGKITDIEERDPSEVADIPGIRILNPAFDITPAGYIDKIVTEYGVIPPQAAYQILVEKFGWRLTEE